MVLSRNDFDKLLVGIKSLLVDQSASKGYTLMKHGHHGHGHGHSGIAGNGNSGDSDLKHRHNDPTSVNRLRNAMKRRITGNDNNGHPNIQKISNLLRRFAKFTAESLWNSMYSRMYRDMKINADKVEEHGKIAVKIMKDHPHRNSAVETVAYHCRRILDMDPSRRNTQDNLFVIGLMAQKNVLLELFCSSWPAYQYTELCKKIRFLRVQPLRKVSVLLDSLLLVN